MLKCRKLSFSVVVLIIFCIIPSNQAYSTEYIIDHPMRVKVIQQELWDKGVNKQVEKNAPSKENKKVIYFPEELELALRLISS